MRVGLATWRMVTLHVTAGYAISSPSCDVVALLQSRWQPDFGIQVAAVQGLMCNINDLNAGVCEGANKCTHCLLQGSNTMLPTNASRFPDSRLLCEGVSTCSLASGSETITFKDPSQVMVCKGSGTCQHWNVQNIGAICCSNPFNFGSVCLGANYELKSSPLCQSDICCDGFRACTDSTFNDIESLLCQGFQSCTQSPFFVSRDLYCDEASQVNPNPTNFGSTCSQSTFLLPGEEHVVDCLGNDVCSRSTLSFSGDNANISMLCNSQAAGTEGGGIGGACNQTTINLSPGDCLDLNCTQDVDCVGLTVSENGGTCYFIGPENAPNRPPECEARSSTQCGPIVPDEICCRDDPDCGLCCEETSTTTTATPPPDISTTTTTSTTTTAASTTTSTTTKKKPYQYSRRNRRQHRRWDRRDRRQNRRQYRHQYG